MSLWLKKLKSRHEPLPNKDIWYCRISLSANSESAVIYKAPDSPAIIEIVASINGSKGLGSAMQQATIDLLADPIRSNQKFAEFKQSLIELITSHNPYKGVSILDEGIPVMDAHRLNFIGLDVQAVDMDTRADIQVPPVIYSDYFNQGNAIVPDILTTNRYVANPGDFELGNYTAGSLAPVIRHQLLNYKPSPQTKILFNDLTTYFEIWLNDEKIFNTPAITGNGTYSENSALGIGANGVGQIDVSDWTKIVKISAQRYATVAIINGGTVVATGQNDEGQLNVTGWSDITDIHGCRYHTLGCKSDGTVLAVGDNTYGQLNVSSWTDIIQVYTGVHHSLGLKSDGTVLAVGRDNWNQTNTSSWENIKEIAAGDWTSFGLKTDGTVVGVGANDYGQREVSSWTNIKKVAASFRHTVGLKTDGTVVGVGDNSEGQITFTGWSGIVDIAAGRFHTLGLKSDGTVLAVGLNNKGQLDVSSWENISQISTGDWHSVAALIVTLVEVSEFTEDYDRYSGYADIKISTQAILQYGGSCKLDLIHKNSGDDYTKSQQFFIDAETYDYSLATVDIVLHTLNSAKYLSGVRFYSTGDIFTVTVLSIDYPNSNSYVNPFIQINFDYYGIQSIYAGPNQVTGWTNDYDAADLSYNSPATDDGEAYDTAAIININNYFSMSSAAKVTANPVDWEILSGIESSTYNILVNTYSNVSTNYYDNFQDEVWRLTAGSYDTPLGTTEDDWKNNWNSQTSLLVYTNALQCWFDSDWTLYYPQLDYTNYNPAGPDYTGLTGRRFYYRAFFHNTSNATSGSIRLYGLTKNDLDTSSGSGLRIAFKIPSKTGWLDLGTEFNYSTYTGADNDGIWQNKSAQDDDWFDFGWKFEDALDASCGWAVVVKISVADTVTDLPTALMIKFDSQEHA